MHHSRCARTLDAYIKGFGRDLWWLPDAPANLTSLALCTRHNTSLGRDCEASRRSVTEATECRKLRATYNVRSGTSWRTHTLPDARKGRGGLSSRCGDAEGRARSMIMSRAYLHYIAVFHD